jgi:hypothetical protein
MQPITVAAQRHEMSSLEHWDREFESYSRDGCSVRISSVFVLCFVGSGLATGRIPIQGFLPTVCKINDFRISLNGKNQEGLVRQDEYEEKQKELKNEHCLVYLLTAYSSQY